MKKFKLLSSLSILGTLSAAVPVVATSCAVSDYTYEIKNLGWKMGMSEHRPETCQDCWLSQFIITKNGEEFVNQSNYDQKISRVELDSDCSDVFWMDPLYQVIRLFTTESGIYRLSLKMTLKDGGVFNVKTDVKVYASTYGIQNIQWWNGVRLTSRIVLGTDYSADVGSIHFTKNGVEIPDQDIGTITINTITSQMLNAETYRNGVRISPKNIGSYMLVLNVTFDEPTTNEKVETTVAWRITVYAPWNN